MENTITIIEYTISVWDKEYNEWLQMLRIDDNREQAIKMMKEYAEREESKAKIEVYEIVEKDVLRDLFWKTRPVISRKLIETIE